MGQDCTDLYGARATTTISTATSTSCAWWRAPRSGPATSPRRAHLT